MVPREEVIVRTAEPTPGPNWIEIGCCATRVAAHTATATTPDTAPLTLLACIRILQRGKRGDDRRRLVPPLPGHTRAQVRAEEAHRIVGLRAAGGEQGPPHIVLVSVRDQVADRRR